MTLQTATSIWKKIALVFLGLFLSLVLLEVGMRLGGFVLLSMQEYRNFKSLKQKGAYRILCIGESTTQGQYPHLLEQVLNQHNIGVRFSVIDKGRGAKTTITLLEEIESNLAQYHPDMVVAMMGTNDHGKHMPFELFTTSQERHFIRSLRTYYLARLLWLHILVKAKEMGLCKPAEDKPIAVKAETPLPETVLKETSTEPILAEDSLKKTIMLNPKNDKAYFSLGWLYLNQGKLSLAEDTFKTVIKLNPNSPNAYVDLGGLYRLQDKFSESEDLFKKAIELNPKNDNVFVDLGWFYQEHSDLPKAEDFFAKAIELNPNNVNALVRLGELYGLRGKFLQAEPIFKRVLELDPKNDNVCVDLGWLYRDHGEFSKGEAFFKKAIELNPENDKAYAELGRLYRAQGELRQAEDSFKKAIRLNPKNDRAIDAMSLLDEERGRFEVAKEYAAKATRLRSEHYAAVTINNYRKLKEILDQKGIKLVCVQYPMRNAEPLKRIFEKDKGVIFVDNESLFKKAVKQSSQEEYFRDLFAGDFGHCTQKGNELLAQNIADVILREVFNKR